MSGDRGDRSRSPGRHARWRRRRDAGRARDPGWRSCHRGGNRRCRRVQLDGRSRSARDGRSRRSVAAATGRRHPDFGRDVGGVAASSRARLLLAASLLASRALVDQRRGSAPNRRGGAACRRARRGPGRRRPAGHGCQVVHRAVAQDRILAVAIDRGLDRDRLVGAPEIRHREVIRDPVARGVLSARLPLGWVAAADRVAEVERLIADREAVGVALRGLRDPEADLVARGRRILVQEQRRGCWLRAQPQQAEQRERNRHSRASRERVPGRELPFLGHSHRYRAGAPDGRHRPESCPTRIA